MNYLTATELKTKMEVLGLDKADYTANNITLEQAEYLQKQLQGAFKRVKLWAYPTASNTGNYGWTVYTYEE